MSLRTTGRLNRSGRTTAEQDVFEGLPIRQWRVGEAQIAPPAQVQTTVDKDAWPELPMPRESHLLPEYTQLLLRRARAGLPVQSSTATTEEEKENEEGEKKRDETPTGFTVKRFHKLPRHLEQPETDYLAKRRKGLPSVHATTIAPTPNVPLQKITVKKVETDGSVKVYESLKQEGQVVEGEITAEEALAIQAPITTVLPGTVVPGIGVANAEGLVVAQSTPIKRRPPPPKRKGGPGRGNKTKKVAFTSADGSTPLAVPVVSSAPALVAPVVAADGTTTTVALDGDTVMGEAQEGNDDEEEGDEGDDDDDSDREEGELSESPGTRTPSKAALALDVDMADAPTNVTDMSAISANIAYDTAAPAEATNPTLEITEPTSATTQNAPPFLSAANLEPPPGPSRDPSSSPDLPLVSTMGHSRSGSLTQPTSDIPSLELNAGNLPLAPSTDAPSVPSQLPSSIAEPDTNSTQPDTSIPTEAPLAPAVTVPPPAPTPPRVTDETLPATVVSVLPSTEVVAAPEPEDAPEPPAASTVSEARAGTTVVEGVKGPTAPDAPVSETSTTLEDTKVAVDAPLSEAADKPTSVVTEAVISPPKQSANEDPFKPATESEEVQFSDGEPDLLGSLERHLENESKRPEL